MARGFVYLTAAPDWFTFNASSGKLYVFEMQARHGTSDADKTKAIDQRLDNISRSEHTQSPRAGRPP